MKMLRVAGVASLALAVATCAGDDGEDQSEQIVPVIIESPQAQVLVGTDTVVVVGPTLFAFFALNPSTTRPSPGLLATARDFQSGLQDAQSALDGLGVRVVAVDQAPTVLGLPGDVDAAAGPTLNGASVGYLFVDGAGHVMRVTSVQGSAGLVCTAANIFGLTLAEGDNPVCPG